MKAITVRQPWASLIAAGVKTIETRPRRTNYRGRIAIHAGKTPYSLDQVPITEAERQMRSTHPVHDSALGAVVASAVLTDCVPMVAERDLSAHRDGEHPLIAIANPDLHGYLATWLAYEPNAVSPGRYIDKDRSEWLRAQLPYGVYSPGRWALLLDDIAPTTERCPWCWPPVDVDGCCAVCGDESGENGRCDPIPARGNQPVPWEWTP